MGLCWVWFGVPGGCGVCRLFVGQFVGVSGCVVLLIDWCVGNLRLVVWCCVWL